MSTRITFAVIALGGSLAAAQPAPDDEPPTPVETAPPITSPEPTIAAPPPGLYPPITITINNNGNNSNTNTQTATQANPQTTTQTASPKIATTVSAPLAPVVTTGGDRPSRIDRIELRGHIHDRHVEAPRRWVALGVLAGESPALRAYADVLVLGPFSLGVTASAAGGGHGHEGGSDRERRRGGDEHDGHSGDASIGGYLAATTHVGRLGLRAQIGASLDPGEVASRHESHDRARTTDDHTRERDDTDGTSGPRLEAALLAAYPLSHHLAAVGGPVVSASPHAHRADVGAFLGLAIRY